MEAVEQIVDSQKVELKNTIRYGKVPALDTKIIILYDTAWGRLPYWFSTNVYISKADYD